VNRFAERIVVTGSGFAVVGTVAAFDDTVRGRLTGLFSGQASSELLIASAQVQRVTRIVTESVGYTGNEDASLVYFVVAAVVLLVCMLRT
jgi:hypothetical protein